MKRAWLRVAENSAARTYTLIISVVAMFLTARLLGPEGRGLLAAVGAWVGLFASFSGLSLGQIAQHQVQRRKREEWLPNILGVLLPCVVVLALLAYLVAVLIYLLSDGLVFKGIPISILLIGFAMLPLMIWEEYSSNLLAAANQVRQYNIAQFAGRSIWLVALIVVFIYGFSAFAVLSAQLIGQVVVGIIGLAVLLRAGGYRLHFDGVELRQMLKGSSQLHLNTVGSFLLAQTTVLMLNHFATKAEVGNYQLAYQMTMMLLIVPQAVSTFLFSRMAEIGPDQLWPEQKHLGIQTGIIMLVLMSLSYFIAPPIILYLAGPGFEPSVKIFHMLLPNLVGLTFAQLMTCQWIGRGVFIHNTFVTFLTAIANLIANAILVPRYGIQGAIWSGWICYFVVTLIFQSAFLWWCEQKYLEFNPSEIH